MMKRLQVLLSAALAVFPAQSRAADLPALQDSFASLAAAAKPAVVNITSVHVHDGHPAIPFFFGDPEDFLGPDHPPIPRGRGRGRPRRWRSEGNGSGVLIDPRGYILTNDHVVSGAEKLKVTLTGADGKRKTVEARVAGSDPSLDLAVIKLQEPGKYPFLKLGDSSKIRVGDWAVAIGSPFGLEQTLTVGVISAVRQSLPIEGRRYSNLIQTDASINQGNSGGPLLNLQGEVVGINTAIYSPSGASAGVGFALAVNEAKAVLDSLLEGRKVSHGYLGVELAEVDEVLRREFDLPEEGGALVNSVLPKSPAEKAGLKRGDLILKLDGAPAENPGALSAAVRRLKAGSKVSLSITRSGKVRELEAILAERPDSGAQPREKDFRPRAGSETESFSWEGAQFESAEGGVEVGEVEEDSPFYGTLLPGDILRAIGKTQVPDLEALRRAAKDADFKKGLALDLLRDGKPLFVSVRR